MKNTTKIVVISDTHGEISHIIDNIRKINPDLILHLGDHAEDIRKISNKLGLKFLNVRGNCDYSQGYIPEDRLLEFGGIKVFMTHGHKYSVNTTLDNLFYKGREMNADIVLFGHTHIPYLEEYEGIKIFNPGSASSPRGGSKASIGLIELADKIKIQNINI